MPLKKNPPYVLAIDVGNTSIAFAIFQNNRIVRRHRCLTHALSPASLKPLAAYKGKIRETIICSVVPGINHRLESVLRQKLETPVVLLGRDRRIPIANKTSKPKQVGMDRLVNAWAAWQRFKRPCVVVDFGTATTFDVVNGKGEYLGGLITPGIQLTLNALAEKTALLPKISLQAVTHVVGRDTVSSIRSGCAYGLGALCDGVLQEIDRQQKARHAVLATGGYAAFMRRYSRSLRQLDPDLTLKAIAKGESWNSRKP